MNNERTPLVTDEQICELVREEPQVMCGGCSLEWDNGAIAGMMFIRAIYEAELARKDAEIEALRREWNAPNPAECEHLHVMSQGLGRPQVCLVCNEEL